MRKFKLTAYFDNDGSINTATWEVSAKSYSEAAKSLSANQDICYRLEIHELFD